MKKCLIFFFLFLVIGVNAKINFYDNDINKIKSDLSSKTTMQKLLLIDNYISKNPNLSDLYLYKAQLEFSLKDFIGVEKTLSKHIENNFFSDSQWKEATYLLGMSFYHNKKLENAYEIFSEIVLRFPEDSTAQFFLNLISLPAKSKIEQEQISGIDVEYINMLNRDYSTENQEEIGNYLYLLYKKSISIKKNNLFDYIQEGAIKVNSLDDSKILESFPISYDSKYFKVVSTEALVINPDGNISKIENENIEYQKTTNGNTKNIVIKSSDIQKGAILCYKIGFKGLEDKKEEAPNVSDIFYVASGIQATNNDGSTPNNGKSQIPLPLYRTHNLPFFTIYNVLSLCLRFCKHHSRCHQKRRFCQLGRLKAERAHFNPTIGFIQLSTSTQHSRIQQQANSSRQQYKREQHEPLTRNTMNHQDDNQSNQ